MANPHKGEVGFEIEGTRYKLSFSANALCEMEDALNLGINEITARLGQADKLRIKTVRAVFWAGLTDHQDGITLKDAGLLLSQLTVAKAVELIAEAFTRAFPEADGEADARPPKPDQDGTGQNS